MKKAVARDGDIGSHGGEIIAKASSIFINGSLIARVGDTYNCPEHGPNPIITGAKSVYGQGQLVAHVGSKTACGATISSGSPNTFIDDGNADEVNDVMSYKEFFILKDDHSNPVPNIDYVIKKQSGAESKGKTDIDGKTQIISSDQSETINLEISLNKLAPYGSKAKVLSVDTSITKPETNGKETQIVREISAEEGAIIVKEASTWNGTPYLYGELSIKGSGADCSGVTARIFYDAGFSYSSNGNRVATGWFTALAEKQNGTVRFREVTVPQTGDVLYWEAEKRTPPAKDLPGHVAIYVEGDFMWSAHRTGGPAFDKTKISTFRNGVMPRYFRYLIYKGEPK